MTFVHQTADVSSQAKLGKNVQVWHHAQIREKTTIGDNTKIGKGSYIDATVVIGNNCKIQNYVSIFQGVTLEDGVFIGPHVCFSNDKFPRAITKDGSLKDAHEWNISKTIVKYGASIGANATILPGITIGKWAMVGAGSVVTKDVPDFALVMGNPARVTGSVNEESKNEKK